MTLKGSWGIYTKFTSSVVVPTVVGTSIATTTTPTASTISVPGGSQIGDLAVLYCAASGGDASVNTGYYTQVGSTWEYGNPPTVGSVGTASGAAFATSWTLNKPGSVSVGDTLFALLITYDNVGNLPTAPSGFALEDTVVHDVASNDIKMFLYRRLADGTEPASWTQALNDTIYYDAVCIRIVGANTTSTIDTTVGILKSHGVSTTQPLPSFTTPKDNELVLHCKAGYAESLTGTPSGTSLVLTFNAVNNIFSKTVPLAGSVASVNATTALSDDYAIFTFVIKPSPSNESNVCVRPLISGDIGGTLPVPGSPGYNENLYTLYVVHSDLGTPVVDVSKAISGGLNDPTLHTFPSVTTTEDNELLLLLTGTIPSGTAWSALPGDATQDRSRISSVMSSWTGHLTQAVAGASGTRTITHDVAYAGWTAWTLGIKNP